MGFQELQVHGRIHGDDLLHGRLRTAAESRSTTMVNTGNGIEKEERDLIGLIRYDDSSFD